MIRVLFITQKIDSADPVLGFFAGWVKSFAKRFEKTSVICLWRGKHDLPPDIAVCSLGKETKASRVRYIINFYRHLWQLRGQYDAVFVHMNQEYILLGGLLWKLTGKRVYMWRNHHAGSFLTDIAAAFCTKVFCPSKFSYTAKYKKTVFMPVGIDEQVFFEKNLERKPHSILFLSRMAPVKKPDVLIAALELLQARGVKFAAILCGDPIPADIVYYESLKTRAAKLGDSVMFMPGIPNNKAPELYGTHQIFVNLSSSGMFDKTILEAMLSGTIVLASNKNLEGNISEQCILSSTEPEEVARKLEALLTQSETDRAQVRAELGAYARGHTLAKLGEKLENELR